MVWSEVIAERGELADLKLTPHVDLPLDWTTQKRVVGPRIDRLLQP